MDRDSSTDVFCTFDLHSTAAHQLDTLFDITDPDMLAVILSDKRSVKAFSVILDHDLKAVRGFCRSDFDYSPIPYSDAVADRVLHKRLDRQYGDQKACFGCVIFYGDIIEADALDVGIDLRSDVVIVSRGQMQISADAVFFICSVARWMSRSLMPTAGSDACRRS